MHQFFSEQHIIYLTSQTSDEQTPWPRRNLTQAACVELGGKVSMILAKWWKRMKYEFDRRSSHTTKAFQVSRLSTEVDVQVLQLEVCGGPGSCSGVASGAAAGVASASSAAFDVPPRPGLDHGRLDSLGAFSLTSTQCCNHICLSFFHGFHLTFFL